MLDFVCVNLFSFFSCFSRSRDFLLLFFPVLFSFFFSYSFFFSPSLIWTKELISFSQLGKSLWFDCKCWCERSLIYARKELHVGETFLHIQQHDFIYCTVSWKKWYTLTNKNFYFLCLKHNNFARHTRLYTESRYKMGSFFPSSFFQRLGIHDPSVNGTTTNKMPRP